ncbi:MAG: 3-methyl-2-oxobutanoate hydroxymethyltransferase [Proteobacteria bacterium]|nr:3-methyl-2-oxobutanoate hydroxymethyltransferase [Pseudomonadota bacterium]
MSEKITVSKLKEMKSSGEKIACLTSYDASFARLQDEAGVDVLLVGDSLGMVLHGDETTLNVTMSDMIYHTRLVSGARQRAIVMSDMPYLSYSSPAQALKNATSLVKDGGANIVKLEGGAALSETVSLMTQQGIAVCGHLGLMPQSIHELGGYHVQAKTKEEAEKLRQDAIALQQAGAACLLLECIPAKVAAEVSEILDIPVIGIGAGPDCDAQVLVVYDLLGLSKKELKFSRNFLIGKDSIADAFKDYVIAVKNKSFPDSAHSYK